MATANTSQDRNPRRRPQRITSADPVGGSSDDTPGTITSDTNARQRRRAQQRLARRKTNDDDTPSPLAANHVNHFFIFLVFLSFPVDLLKLLLMKINVYLFDYISLIFFLVFL